MIQEPSKNQLYTLKVDLVNGLSYQSPVQNFKDGSMALNNHGQSSIHFPSSNLALPPSGFKLRIQPVVDLAMQITLNKHLNETMEAIMTMSNMFFKQSPHFKIDLEVLPFVTTKYILPASVPNIK